MYSVRLLMPIGEAMFSQRSIRHFRPDPVPIDDIRLLMEAAVKAPNGGKIREFGPLYHEAWWAKRREEQGWTRSEDISETTYLDRWGGAVPWR
jgi:nitroreductase